MLGRESWEGKRSGIVAAATAIVVILIGAAGASALSFSSPKTIGKAGTSHGFPRIAVNAQGLGTAVWHNYERRNGRIEAVRLGPNGSVTLPKVISDPSFDANNAELGVSDSGRAAIVWEAAKAGKNPIQWTTLGADGSQGPVEGLPGEGSEPVIAVNGDGQFVIAWTHYNDQGGADLDALVVQPDGSAGPVVTLEEDVDPTGDGLARATIDASGRATVMWEAYKRNPAIYAAQLDGSGIVTPSITLSDPKKLSYIGSIATGADGDSMIVWTQRSGEVKARPLSSDGTPGRIRTLSGRNLTGVPAAVMDESGRATIAWTTGSGLLRWVRLAPNGAPGTKRKIKASGAGTPDMGADRKGRVWITWNRARLQKKSGYYVGSIRAVRLSASGKAGRVRTLTRPNEDTYDFQGLARPDVAVNGQGVASVIWADATNVNARIRLIRSVP